MSTRVAPIRRAWLYHGTPQGTNTSLAMRFAKQPRPSGRVPVQN